MSDKKFENISDINNKYKYESNKYIENKYS